VARRFDALGLTATGEAGSFLQTFTAPAGPAGKPVEAANIVGVLPGMKPEWNGQSVLVTAHLDHLGLGWPDVRKGNEGKVHPGADDNASGVAVLLELARVFASGEKPKRTIVFVVFTGEEAGRLGSKHYASHPGAFPLEKVMGVVNIDTVGRLFDQKLSVLGTGTASEWQHIFRGASFVTGVESRNVPESAEASDQLSFIEKGVPAVQIFSGAHADYHRPSDTADRVDGAGLVKVATFVKEGIAYLAERPEPLTNTIPRPAGGAPPPAAQPAGAGAPARRVSFGTVPDFEFPGPGVKVTGVVPGSPAEKAGVKEGDILMAIDGQPVTNLRGYSDILKTLSPGQTVKAAFKRGGQDVTLPVTLAER
jgi:aminopeptidase N